MSEWIKLKASDGHELDAYVAQPEGNPVAGLVVIQEIFGVNSHIRSVADSYAQDGFLVVAPALFDRVEKNVDLGYEGEDRQKAMALYPKLQIDAALLDVSAASEYAREKTGKTGVIGYCFGGTVAWLCSTRLKNISAAVGYYAGGISNFAAEAPTAPVMLHFGNLDKHIPREGIDGLQAAHPEVEIFWYDADHGFNCDQRSSYQPEASRRARERSLAFLKSTLAG